MKINLIFSRLCNLIIFIVLCVIQSGKLLAAPDLPDDNLSYPVLLISKDNTGSGFLYNKSDASYLVTARHVLFKETSVQVGNKFLIPKPLIRNIYWKEVQEDKNTKEFNLNFLGVMSENERDELIKSALNPDNYKETERDKISDSFNKTKAAIEQLYKQSQHLILKNERISTISYVPKKFGEGVNEYEIQLSDLFIKGLVKYHPSKDVAFIKIGIPQTIEGQRKIKLQEGVVKKRGTGSIGVGFDSVKLLKDVIVGNHVYVFGYPSSITAIDPWMDIKLPLLRGGIIAGKNEDLNVIILDCPIFFGNSGGLVIEVERTSLTDIRFMAIGLVTNYVPYLIDWKQNSGYSVVVPMDFVEELISGNVK